MLNDMVIVDATVHPYDLGVANQGSSPNQAAQIEGMYHHHRLYTGESRPEYTLERDEFVADFNLDGLSAALFAESQTDLAVLHALPNLGFSKHMLTDIRRMANLRDRYPNRYLLYATVNSNDTDAAIKELEWQVNEIGVDGLKLYPAFYYDGRSVGWKMNDPDFSIPLFEVASDLGITNIAIHKAIPVGPASISSFKVDDFDEPLFRFRHINFQMVHAGFAFLEETRMLIHRHPNFYANLESTFCNILDRPALFLEAIGELLFYGSADQLLYASGSNLIHPRPLLDAFEHLEMPDHLVEERAFPKLTPEIKAKILGGNALRLHGRERAAVVSAGKSDEFGANKQDGLCEPWAGLRAELKKLRS